jgi:hypothetical protein
MVAQVGYSVAGRSRGRVAPCAICTMHVETRSTGFLVEPQNQGRRFVSGLASKPMLTVSSGLASKPAATVFSSLASKLVVTVSPGLASKPAIGFMVEPQNQGGGGFAGLGLKITTAVSWFGPQNQVGFGLSVAPQNRRREVGTGHTSRSSGLLDTEASLARVYQSNLKTGRGTTAGGACGTIPEVASEAS